MCFIVLCLVDKRRNRQKITFSETITGMRQLFFFIFLFALGSGISAQQIHYEFAAPNAAHHEAQVSLTASQLPAGPVVFMMSRSSPGRYAKHEFGKNVYDVKAFGADKQPLAIEKTDADVYTVKSHNGTVTVQYTLYGNYADGTYVSIDPTNYHLNMPATFMWVKSLEKAPISIHFTVPDSSWKIATQLPRSDKAYTFTARNLQYFMDAPTKIGPLHINEWKVTNPDNKSYTMQLALEAQASEGLVDSFTQKLKKIVKEAQAVFGEVPHYDYGKYTFIASLNPYAHGDGMEHRNSTMITSGRVFTGADNFLNTFAHEFFHCWNVERIRPASLEPFDFSKSNMSEALWVAEGFTQYYGLLLMKRAGFTPDSIFNLQMASLINAKENTPGGKDYTPIENSQRAVFVDAGVSIDNTNYPNMFTSYYYYGAALALALDMQLRANFNKTLDGFMQQMWNRFGKTEKPYTMKSMQQMLAEYTSTKFATAFFKDYVFASKSINYQQLMEAAGLQLTRANAGKAWIGATRFNVRGGDLVIQDVTIRNTPLYEAGADVNDVLISLGDDPMHSAADVDNFLKTHRPGDVFKISYKHRDEIMNRTITLSENPAFTLQASPAASSEQQQFYNEWTRPHAK